MKEVADVDIPAQLYAEHSEEHEEQEDNQRAELDVRGTQVGLGNLPILSVSDVVVLHARICYQKLKQILSFILFGLDVVTLDLLKCRLTILTPMLSPDNDGILLLSKYLRVL